MNHARTIAVCLLFFVFISACSRRLPPASDLVAIMPESTHAVLVVQSPKTGPDGERGIFDEAAIAAHMGMVELLERFGGFCVTMPLNANRDEDWHAVGIATRLDIAAGKPGNLRACNLVFVTRSKTVIDGPKSDWASMLDQSELERVGEVENVPVFLAKDNPPDDAMPERQGAYIAVLDHTLVIASLERQAVEECIRREHSKSAGIPPALREIAGTIPAGVDGYLLCSHRTEAGGVRLSAGNREVQLGATALSMYRAPGSELAYRFSLNSPHPQADMDRLAAEFLNRNAGDDESGALATVNRGGVAGAEWIELRYDLEKVRAAMSGEGILMGISFTYQQTLADTGAIHDDADDHPRE